MKEKKLSELLIRLKNEEYLTAKSLSEKLGVSEKTIRNWIKELNSSLEGNGGHIESKHGYGYFLVEEDSAQIQAMIHKLTREENFLPITSENRVMYLLDYLLKK